jgi:integrase
MALPGYNPVRAGAAVGKERNVYRRGSVWWSSIAGVRTSLRTEDREDAAALEAKLKHEHFQQAHLGGRKPRTWEEACVRWEKENSHKVSWKDDVRAIRWWTQFLGGRDIRTITRELIDEIIRQERQITAEGSSANNTANHLVAYAGAILNAAARKWDWTDKAPLLRRYPAPDGRKRWLSVGEWKALEVSLPDHVRLAARFALATGIRRGILASLEWGRIDTRDRHLSFPGTQNKLGNTIPLNDTAMSVLEEIQTCPVRHMQLVFTENGHALRHYHVAWYKALDKLGLRGNGGEDFCWHGLRHTWASWLAQAGVPEWARKRLGGWSSAQMVDRYSHLDLEALRPYAAVIDTILAQGTDRPAAKLLMGK